MTIHPDDEKLFGILQQFAAIAAETGNYSLAIVEPKRRPHPGGALGLCYQSENRICFAIRFKEGPNWWRNRLSIYDILDTILHEVCHLPSAENPDGLKDGAKHIDAMCHLSDKLVKRFQ